MEPRTLTFAEYVEARSHDSATGLMAGEERFMWAQVVAAARARARLASSICCKPGQARGTNEAGGFSRPVHIGVLLDNTPEYVFWILAAALSGNVAVGINPTRRGTELAADIRHTDCDMIVTDAEHAGLVGGLATGVPAGRTLIMGQPAYETRLASLAHPRSRSAAKTASPESTGAAPNLSRPTPCSCFSPPAPRACPRP